MSEYTKGPWKATKIEEGKFHIERDEPPSDHNYVPIACIDHSRDGHDATRQVTAPADAHLIAAAPAMYEALKACHLQLIQSNNISEYEEEAIELARAALAKAVPHE